MAGTERVLGTNQRSCLRFLRESKSGTWNAWHPMWVIDTVGRTKRVFESLYARGLVDKEGDTYKLKRQGAVTCPYGVNWHNVPNCAGGGSCGYECLWRNAMFIGRRV